MLGLLVFMLIALVLLVTLLTAMLTWQMVHPPRRSAAWALARSLPSDPNDLGLAFEEWWLDRPPRSKVRLPVWDVACSDRHLAASDQVTPLTAVFIHGWGHGRVNSLQRIEPFLPLVDRIVMYDLRGHGDAVGGASMLGQGEDVDLLALLERLGAGPFLLVGHSMGSVIALRAAVNAMGGSESGIGRIAGVIAYGPYCDFHRSLRGRLSVNGLPARPLTDLALLAHRVRGLRPPAVDPRQLAGLKIPVLIVHGVNDLVSPLEHARAIAGAAPNAELIEVDDAAHTDAHWVDRAAHDHAVRAFIERVRAERNSASIN